MGFDRWQMRHPFIVNLHHAFQSREKLYYILDYCPGGELFYHLNVLLFSLIFSGNCSGNNGQINHPGTRPICFCIF